MHHWLIEPGGLRLGPFLRISFQRYPRPASGVLDARPSSWGALPIGVADGGLLIIPLAVDEAVWLGLSIVRPEVVVAFRVATTAETPVDAVTGDPWSGELREGPQNYLQVPPARSIDGVRQSHGVAPFTRGSGAGGISALHLTAIPSRRVNTRSRPAGMVPFPLRVPTAGGATNIPPPAPMHGPWHLERATAAYVEFASLSSFEQRTGRRRPPALDPDATYKGWRLP